MDWTPRVALDVCASFAARVTRSFLLVAIATATFSQACQRENAAPAFDHAGARSAAVTSADSAVSSASNFNATSIAAGRTVWFTSVFKASGVPSTGATINVLASKITFTAGTTSYTVDVPAGVVTISPTATAASTTYDVTSATWRTTLPLSWSGNGFLTALALPVTVALPGGINPVTWSADFVTDPPGLTINWQWAAAVYTQFSSSYNALQVKPVDDPNLSAYKSSDHAGTPEAYKPYVIGGARGGGGSNYTGSLSGTVTLTTHACTTTCAAPNGCQMLPICHSNGTCSYQAVADGTSCNDDNANTVNDKCTAGVCAGVDLCANVTCTASDQCHAAGSCDHSTGACSNPTVANGTTCNDGNANTVNDKCTAGVCAGVDLCANVTCTASDQCHIVGTCDHSTGACSNPTVANGTTCNDGNANTVNDKCTAGVCAGVDFCANVTCTASDQCHVVGTCDHSTGACSNPTVANGTTCNDGNANTVNDKCTAGVCAGVDLCANVTCTASDQCHAVGTCDHTNGACSNPSVPDGTGCAGGQCTAGLCVPSAPSNRAPVVSAGIDQTVYLAQGSQTGPAPLSFQTIAPEVDANVVAPIAGGALVATSTGDLVEVSDDGTSATFASLAQPLGALAIAPDGTVFAGGQLYGGPKIFRISPDGATINPAWANYSSYDWPGALLLGSDGFLYANDSVGLWRFDADGNGAQLSNFIGVGHIAQVPQDAHYGPLSGLIVGATDGQVTGVDGYGNTITLALNVTSVIGIHVVPPHATFLGLDGMSLREADASAFAGDLMVLTWPNGLYRVRWNGSALQANRVYPSDVSWWTIDFRPGTTSGNQTAFAQLAGSATDDGLPNPPGQLTAHWSAPGGVSIANADVASTSATFSTPGAYTLTLTASDAQLTSSADTHVTVAGGNQAPIVNAGQDATVSVADGADLAGTARDDGVPGPLSYAWTMRSGPGTALFANASSPATHVTFDVPGTYVLQLAVSDGALAGFDVVTIQVTTREGLLVSLTSPPTVGPNQEIPYTLTITNTSATDYSDVQASVTGPDGYGQLVYLGPVAAGASAQAGGWVSVPTTMPYWRLWWQSETDAAYLARLHAMLGAPELVAANATAVETGTGTLHLGSATSTSTIALAIVRPTSASFSLDPFVPDQQGTLTIELVNEGSLDAHNVYADARSIREWKTIDIPAGQTAELVSSAGAPINQSGDFTVDLQTVSDEASVYWDDQFNAGYGDTLARWSGTAIVPNLALTASAVPPVVLPSQQVIADATITNVGHATAVSARLGLAGVPALDLADFAPGAQQNVSAVALTAPALPDPSQWYGDTDLFLYYLRILRDRGPLDVDVFWRDIVGNQYERAAPVDSTVVLPIVSPSMTSSTAGPLYLRDTISLEIDVRNEGTADAVGAHLQFGVDVNEGQPFVQPGQLSDLFPISAMAPGTDKPVALPAAVPFVPFPPSDPLHYYFWLYEASRNGLLANLVAQWSDTSGNVYGPIGRKSFVSLAVPIVETDLQQLQTTCTFFCTSVHVPWRLDLTPGAHNDLVFPWNASGTSTARDARITARVHGTTQVLSLPSAIEPGDSGTAMLHWAAPPNPTGRQAGEAQDAYLTRLKTPATSPEARLDFTWADDHGNLFGPISSPVSSTLPRIVIGEPRPLVVSGLPGTLVQMQITWTGGVGTPDLVLHSLGNDIRPPYNVRNGDFVSYDYTAPLWFPGSLPAAPARASTGSDDAYTAALTAVEAATVPMTWRMTWTANGDAYGPTDGAFNGNIVLPNLTARKLAAEKDGQTAQRIGITLTNNGHADATSAHVQFVGDRKLLRAFDLPVPAGAVIDAAFYAPAEFVGDRLDYEYAVTWTDAAGNGYGPLHGSGTIYGGAKNQPPSVAAGPGQTVLLSNGADLAGVVDDDGRPGTGLTQRWTQVTGPGWATFADATSPATHASFSQTGTYVLQLWASDGELASADKTTINIVDTMPANRAPLVDAGPPQTFTPPGSVVPPAFQLAVVATGVNGGTGIDDHPVSGTVLVSVNYSNGYPYNFALVHQDGTSEQFSNVHGLTDEVYFVTGRDEDGAGHTLGGFDAGEVFAGTGVAGDIIRISPDGSTVQNPWAHLPGETGLLRGGLAFDHTGVFGYDLIVATNAGGIWRVNSGGAATRVAQLGRFLEGIMTVPNDPTTYGPWAGTILTGAEGESALYTIDVHGTVARWDLGISGPENMHLAPAGENFFGSDQQRTIYGASAEQLAPFVGQIVITEEFTGVLWRVRWNGTQFVKNFMAQNASRAFEGVGFSPAGLGPVQSQWLTAQLHGSATDDGLPNPPEKLTAAWTKVSGPGTAIFDDAASFDTTVHVEKAGAYVLRLTVSDSDLSGSSDVTIGWNPPDRVPAVDAGGDQVVYLPSVAQLGGSASDDGLPAGSTLTTTWSEVAGPGTVAFANGAALSTTASFSAPGEYLLRLSASDGELVGVSEMRVTVLPAGAKPVVSAGAPQTVLTSFARLQGVVHGAVGEVIQSSWDVISGPAAITFDDASSPATIARFSAPGTYVMRLSATSVAQSIAASDTTTVEVLATGDLNLPPVVDAGADQLLPWPVSVASLSGKATDDGNPSGVLSASWSQVSGPGTAQFQTPSSPATAVTVDQPGRYVLRLTASDSQLTASSDVVVTFAQPGHSGPGGIWITGHDPEASASVGQNAAGAQRQLELALAFVAQDTLTPHMLVVTREREFYFTPAWPEPGLASIGLPRDAYDEASAHPGGAVLDLHTIDFNKYDVVLVVSDDRGPLSQSELDVLVARTDDLRRFVNAGGSIIASAESGLRPDGVDQVRTNLFGFLSLAGTSAGLQQPGIGNVVMPAGSRIGLTNADINGDPTWVTFAAAGAMDVIDVDSAGRILTLAERGQSLGSSGISANAPPMVTARSPSIVQLDQAARLTGTVTDDGLPANAGLTVLWTQAVGPGLTTFADASSASTTVTFSRAGRYILRLTANDSVLSGSADVVIDVIEPNDPPFVSAGPDQDIASSSTKLAGTVVDDGRPQGAALSWGWQEESGPGDVRFADPLSLAAVATFTEPGTYVLRLWANDTMFYAHSEVVIHVQDAGGLNQPPFVDVGLNPVYVSLSGSSVQATLTGTVVDDGLPSNATHSIWSLAQGPALVQFANATLAATTATFTSPGTYKLRLAATDTALTTTATLTVVVLGETNQPPTVVAGNYPTVPYPQHDLRLAGMVADDGNPAGSHIVSTWSLRAGEGTALFDDVHDLNTVAHFSWPGQYVLHLDATDGEASFFDEVVVTVDAAPGDAPAVALIAADDGSRITAPVDVIGTVSDGQWKLELALGGDDGAARTWRQIGGGTGAASGVLGTLDPTLLLNGTWSLRLSAETEGGTSEDQRSVIVDKNLKIGTFAFSVTDMTVPVPGLPVQVIRSYDSRDTRDGDFGHGWSLSVSDVRLEKTAVLGKSWAERIEGDYRLPRYCLAPTRPDVVTVTFPTGKVYRFDASLSITCQPFAPIDTPEMQFTAQKGTVGTLRVLGTSPTVYVSRPYGPGSSVLLLDSDMSVYNPTDFVLTTEDGTQYAIHQGNGLEWVQDRNGNTLTFSQQGITSSAGKSVSFVRDAQGHISAITDPNGNSLLYGYNQQGDLVSFTDRAGHSTQFGYGPAHQLFSITDPRGKQVLGNHYDDAGRLTSTDDAAGKSIIFGHDPAHHRETVTDRSGKTTTYEYDPDGNVVHVIDALGHETFSTYDDNDNKLTDTDALGHTTISTYDARNNKTSEKDPLGHITTWTYGEFSNLVTTEDPLHHITSNERATIAVCGQASPSGNLLSVTNAKSEKTSYTYNCDGTVATQKDARQAVTTYTYSGGLLQSVQDPLGNVTSYTYDGNGNQKTETRTRIVDGVVETLVTSYEYDGNGQRTKMTYPDGTFTRTDYNELGKAKSTFDQLGRETKYTYDDQGRLSVTAYPDQTTSSTTYDENGRRKTSTDRGGRATSFGYDDVGRLKTTTYPDNSARTTEYDEAGRVRRTFDELGLRTTYKYDDAGRRISVTDALEKLTTFGYDDAGNESSVTDANQNTVLYGYDELNRQVRVTYPDQTVETTEYDAQGNRSARVGQAGIRTEYGYDLLGHLTSVTNKNVNGVDLVTRYTYDEQGNRTSQTDANEHTTRFTYDKLGRRSSRILPLGQTDSFTYYADGQQHTRTDLNGHITRHAYDDAGRLTTRTPDPYFASEVPVTFTYWPNGRRKTMSDGTGATSYSYDVRDRLLTKTTPEGALTYTYDAAGNRKTVQSDSGAYDVTYGYDELNRLSSVTDNTAGGGTTLYHYDDGGRLAAYNYPNGVSTTLGYDANNRLKLVTIGTLASYAYDFYATGNRKSVTEKSGRKVTWQYDNLWRLTNETIAGTTNTDGEIGYVYDDVGNRLSRSSSVAGIPNQTSSYDDDDRLLSDGWDANGNTLTSSGNQYRYDSENRLLSLNTSQARYVYDGDGQLVHKSAGGITTAYLIDDQTPAGYTQVVEERVSGAVQKSYVFGPQRISLRDSAGLHYYGYDAHSGVRLVMDASGTVTDTWEYDAFGNVVGRIGTLDNGFTYRGEQVDSPSGLQYLRARWMDSAQGRFDTRDTWLGIIEEPIGLNTYAYASANPLDLSDPSGHWSNLGIGLAAHIAIGVDWARQGPNRIPNVRTITNLCGGGIPQKFGGWRRPDMADPVSAEVYEIKPFGSQLQGEKQLQEYIDLLNNFDALHREWHAGTTFKPKPRYPLPAVGVNITTFGPTAGVVLYDVMDDNSGVRASDPRIAAVGALLVLGILIAVAASPLGI
jgi:RHS repeat-associated protein